MRKTNMVVMTERAWFPRLGFMALHWVTVYGPWQHAL